MPYSTQSSPISRSIMILPGSRTYLLGNAAASGGKYIITAVSIATNVATVTVTGWEGPLPYVGTLVTIRGTQNGGGEFNVTNAPITAFTLDQTGAGTISFALTGANLATTADNGTLTFDPQIVGETAINNAFTLPGALARPSGARGQQSVFCQMAFPTAGVTALTITMQESSDNLNWVGIPTAQTLTVAAPACYFETTALFVRGALSGLTGAGVVALEVNI